MTVLKSCNVIYGSTLLTSRSIAILIETEGAPVRPLEWRETVEKEHPAELLSSVTAVKSDVKSWGTTGIEVLTFNIKAQLH